MSKTRCGTKRVCFHGQINAERITCFVFLLNSLRSNSKGCCTEGAQSGGLEPNGSEAGELQGVLSEGASAGPEEGKLDVVEGKCSGTPLQSPAIHFCSGNSLKGKGAVGGNNPEPTKPQTCFHGC